MKTQKSLPLTGTAAGVPFLAHPPVTGPRSSAPVVIAWHMLDPPRTETAFASALPLAGMDAWRIYLGLPMSGARIPEGGPDELMRLASQDAILNVYGPVIGGAAEEFAPALSELRERLEIDEAAPVGLVGGSAGAAVAGLVLAESDIPIDAAVLISPITALDSMIKGMENLYGVRYNWTTESQAIARRLDLLVRAADIAARPTQPAVQLIVGERDDERSFREPAAAFQQTLRHYYADPRRVVHIEIPEMAHALAEEPGVEPAAQTPQAALVDRYATRWLDAYL